jgi:transcriptional regulator with XRE-family HTH domain
MSPRSHRTPLSRGAAQALSRMAIDTGSLVQAERARRRWSLATLADRAGISDSHLQTMEAGEPASLEAYARVLVALGLRPTLSGMSPRTSTPNVRDDQDFVHAAMGEVWASRLSSFGFTVRLDEPYQHYQFAGRADVVAFDPAAKALLHIENRTRFPNVQEALGSFGAKRSYLGPVLAERLGIRGGWRSETHVVAALWTSEVIHVLRLRPATFTSACPDPIDGVVAWWNGAPPMTAVSSSLVLFDPAPGVRPAFRVASLGPATKPRHRGYAEVAHALRSSSGQRKTPEGTRSLDASAHTRQAKSLDVRSSFERFRR